MADIEKVDLASENLVDDRLDKLKELMPEVFTESGIDFDKLRLELGDEVDEGQERYAFTWPGKMNAIRQSQIPSTATLRPCMEKSRSRDGEDGSFDSDNIYIEGDNLEVLKLLQRGYHGKVKMIYIDPPYNTGHDFVYKDNFGNTIENYKEQTGLASQSNADTSGRFHSDWCSMMYPRLRLARELLSDDGSLVISIGSKEVNNLIKICQEIFPDKQVVSITVQTSGGKPSGGFNLLNEYLVFVVDEEFQANRIDRFGGTQRSPFEGLPLSTFNKIQRPNQTYPIYINPTTMSIVGVGKSLAERIAEGTYNGSKGSFQFDYDEAPSGTVALWPYTSKGKECIWRLKPERLMADWEKGYIKVSNNQYADCPNRYSLQYLPDGVIQKVENGSLEVKGVEGNGKTLIFGENQTVGSQIPSILTEKEYQTVKGTSQLKDLFNVSQSPFDYPKPVELIEDLIGMTTCGEDTILDFFSGSSTSAHACMVANLKDASWRRWIMVQLPELCGRDTPAYSQNYRTICEAAQKRIVLAGDKIKAALMESNRQLKLDEKPKELPDIGFRVFALDDSGIERPEPGQLVLDVVKPDRSELDIVFEMMLKWGLELTLPVEKSDAAGYPIWSVACDELVCCMSRGLTIEALEAIADMEPRRMLILDSVLDDTLKLNAVQIFKHAGERMGCEIELRTV